MCLLVCVPARVHVYTCVSVSVHVHLCVGGRLCLCACAHTMQEGEHQYRKGKQGSSGLGFGQKSKLWRDSDRNFTALSWPLNVWLIFFFIFFGGSRTPDGMFSSELNLRVELHEGLVLDEV